MKKLFPIFLILFCASVVISSCKKEEDPPYLTLTPSSVSLDVPPGSLIEFRVRAYAGDNELRNLLITEKPENSVTTTIKDTTLYGETADFFYIYSVPNAGIEQLLLRFTIYDRNGKSNSTIVQVNIDGNTFLNQTTGHQLRNLHNTINDAFDISEVTVFSLDAPGADSTLTDIVEYSPTNDGSLSKTWTSYTGIKFVRNNDFNYAEATAASAENTFNSSSQQLIITNLQTNDIIITKYDTVNNKYAVLRMVNIVDVDGVADDYYEFNLKK